VKKIILFTLFVDILAIVTITQKRIIRNPEMIGGNREKISAKISVWPLSSAANWQALSCIVVHPFLSTSIRKTHFWR
jgi:hypothetical protein